MNHYLRVLLFLAVCAIAVCSAGSPASRAAPGASADPQYDKNGELKRPADFRTWIFVGANIGLQYRKDSPVTAQREQDRHKGPTFGDFHNIYIRPESYEQYLKTGKFPERTVLVIDDYESKEKDQQNVVSKGLYPGDHRRIEVAVKNRKRPDGSKTDWAYYVFEAPTQTTAKAFADSACYDCHRQHANVDNVWVQFYPILRAPEKARAE
jgi:hypothetical protein